MQFMPRIIMLWVRAILEADLINLLVYWVEEVSYGWWGGRWGNNY